MPHSQSPIPQLLPAPGKEECLYAISKALLEIRNKPGWTVKSLAKELACSPDVVRAGTNEDNLIAFDTIVRLCFKFPDETGLIRQLFGIEGGAPPTLEQRFDRVTAEIHDLRAAALRRETA